MRNSGFLSTPQNSAILRDVQNQCWLYFHSPIKILTTYSLKEVMRLLEAVQQQVQDGYYAVGFVSYEASPAFDYSFTVVNSCSDFPLVWFGLYTQPQILASLPLIQDKSTPLVWTPSISQQRYREAIHQIKDYIARGDTYQVNFSFRLQSAFSDDPWAYFTQLIGAQPSCYGAFINLADWAICSASPELFFQLNHQTLMCRPMKGTAPRGLIYRRDQELAEQLRHSEKNRAENLMIVDMVRNDMGRIATTGSVKVTQLFDVEQYPTVWQMTSLVQCLTDAHFSEILPGLFPCASITGAPKSRTMEIITELEDTPRRIYTGTIGFLTPQQTAQFNVAIRTVLINKKQQVAEYGVGGGIVWDSQEISEFEEAETKAKILTQWQPSFDLLESLLWTPNNEYFLLELHLKRLQESAAYFGFTLNVAEVRRQLTAIAHSLPPKRHKVRLCVSKTGKMQIQAEYLAPQSSAQPLKLGLAECPINSANVFLYHKTTYRVMYEQARQGHSMWDDVLLWNERGEVTESCIANLVFEWDGRWYTPPVECGLLAGTLRAWLLQQGTVKEKVLLLKDLPYCSRLLLVNSVRRIQEAMTHN